MERKYLSREANLVKSFQDYKIYLSLLVRISSVNAYPGILKGVSLKRVCLWAVGCFALKEVGVLFLMTSSSVDNIL